MRMEKGHEKDHRNEDLRRCLALAMRVVVLGVFSSSALGRPLSARPRHAAPCWDAGAAHAPGSACFFPPAVSLFRCVSFASTPLPRSSMTHNRRTTTLLSPVPARPPVRVSRHAPATHSCRSSTPSRTWAPTAGLCPHTCVPRPSPGVAPKRLLDARTHRG